MDFLKHEIEGKDTCKFKSLSSFLYLDWNHQESNSVGPNLLDLLCLNLPLLCRSLTAWDSGM